MDENVIGGVCGRWGYPECSEKDDNIRKAYSIGQFWAILGPSLSSTLRACSAGTVPFCSATVSTVKRGFFPFRNGRKRAICMEERNGTVPAEQALRVSAFMLHTNKLPYGNK